MRKQRTLILRRVIYGIVLIAAVSLLVVNLPRTSFTQTSDVPRRAPLNPAFVDYMNARVRSLSVPQAEAGRALGLVPSPHNIPPEALRPLKAVSLESLPMSYDLRTLSKLTAIRNQGDCGSCWAFAAYGSLESFYKPGQTYDFSENDMICQHGWDYDRCLGGNMDMAAAYLARWGGPVSEADYTYNPTADCKAPGFTVRKHVQNIIYYPDRASSSDNAAIKQAVMTSGAVYVTMDWCDGAIKSTTAAYYNDGSYSVRGGHAVCIVGWNDGYSRSNFNKLPPTAGAFIVRNSWGDSWGKSGYFYVSYCDVTFGRGGYGWDAASVTAEAVTNHSTIYQYDPLGWVGSVGFGSTTAWGANIFTAANTDPLTAVSFYAGAAGTSYQISVYTGVTAGQPKLGTLQCSLTGSTTYAGYYTIDLPTSVPLTAGQRFSVVIKFTTPGYSYPVPVEYAYAGVTSDATASSGQSFVSSAGSTWYDTTSWAQGDPTENVCIKAFAGESQPATPITVTAPAAGASWGRGTSQTIAWDTTGITSPNVSIVLMQGTTLVNTISASTASSGSFSWSIPSNLSAGSNYFVRVKTTDEEAQGDSGLFIITAPSVTVTSPAAGDAWYKGETKLVTWTLNGSSAPYVKIQLYHGSVLTQTITSSAPSSLSFNWKIGKALTARNDYYLKITTTDGKATGLSGLFSIKAPKIAFTSPTGGSLWTRTTTLPITWTKTGPQNAFVKLVLRRNGVVKLTIAASTDNDGALDWVIPASLAVGSGYDIRITTVDGVVKAISGKFSLN